MAEVIAFTPRGQLPADAVEAYREIRANAPEMRELFDVPDYIRDEEFTALFVAYQVARAGGRLLPEPEYGLAMEQVAEAIVAALSPADPATFSRILNQRSTARFPRRDDPKRRREQATESWASNSG